MKCVSVVFRKLDINGVVALPSPQCPAVSPPRRGGRELGPPAASAPRSHRLQAAAECARGLSSRKRLGLTCFISKWTESLRDFILWHRMRISERVADAGFRDIALGDSLKLRLVTGVLPPFTGMFGRGGEGARACLQLRISGCPCPVEAKGPIRGR